MTGWRLGFIFAPAETSQLNSSRVISIGNCCNAMAQHTAVEALTAGKERYKNP